MIKSYPKVIVQCDNDPAHEIEIELCWVDTAVDKLILNMYSTYTDKHIREELVEAGWNCVGEDRWFCGDCEDRRERDGQE